MVESDKQMKDKKHKKEQEEADNLMEAASQNSAEKVSFEVYFQILLKEKKVLAHHKPPMRQFAEAKGLSSGTKSEFDELFKTY